MHIQTKTILAGSRVDSSYNSVTTPIYQTSTFRFEDIGKTKGFDYTRSGNPTRAALERAIADLEEGSSCVAVTSGMAAIATTLHLFSAGDEIIATHDCYGGTERLLLTYGAQFGIVTKFVDMTSEEAVLAAITPNTKALWVETPSNPLLNIIDIRRMSTIAKAHNLLTIVDNTFLSPYNQKPFALGADIVVHSTTKYLNGHSDVVGGAVVTNSNALDEKIKFHSNCIGSIAQPYDCWLVLRGIKTLALRMREHEKNARAVAEYLSQHENVQRVFYPGLSSHPQHELAQRQQNGFGGIVSFEVKGAQEEVNFVLRGTRIFQLAESLGGIESLIEQPATMSHASMRREAREAAGITTAIIRLSVGTEHIEDLLEDLDGALNFPKWMRSHVQEKVAADL